MSARCKARLILFSGFFFPIGLTPRGDKHTRSDPREPRPGTPLRGARSSALWRPLRPNGRTTPENKISRASGDDGQFGGRFPVPHRGGRLYRSTTSDCPHSFARQRDRSAYVPLIPHPGYAHPCDPFAGYNGWSPLLVAHAPKRGTSYPCTSSHAARKDRRARCRSWITYADSRIQNRQWSKYGNSRRSWRLTWSVCEHSCDNFDAPD